jgi:hypothetical protein
MEEFLAAQERKSPVRRDFSIAGVKELAPQKAEDHPMVDDLAKDGIGNATLRARIWNIVSGDVNLT